ncbi:hypothetical protein ACLS0R_19495, partial [Comamonas jiangduensis]|uniref:hypothetical protein n=1 Tax=Comamonas jiangduensis TaxID=1194168 RepID=UPI003BF8FD22
TTELPNLPIECAPHVELDLTARQARTMLAIRAKTEQLKQTLRQDSLWGTPVYLPPRGFPLKPETSKQVLAEQLPWPALLTLANCAEETAVLARCSVKDLLLYAIHICPYQHVAVLIQFLSHQEGIQASAKALSPYIRQLRDKVARIKEGARKGADKSAHTRHKQSKVPAPQDLKREADKLMASHYAKQDVAGILAKRYDVTPTTIRRKLNAAT